MVFSEYKNVRIAAIAASVPKEEIDFAAKAEDPNEDPKYINSFIKKTGIAFKRRCPENQTAADYSYAAAKQIEEAGYYKPDEISVLINLTQTPDYRTPSTALQLHKRLKLSKSCLAFDINLGCSGFVYGVSLAASILNTSNGRKALVLIGDTLARGRKKSKSKRASNTAFLFGDASSAVLIEKAEGHSFTSALMSDGTGHKALSSPYNAWRHPEGPESIPGDDIAVFNFTINEVPTLINKYLEMTDANIEDYDDLVLHQANLMILKNIAKRVGMPMEKVPICLDRFGNTSGCSVPLAIVDKYGESVENKEINLLTSSFGIGLSWGVVGFSINTKDVLPMTIGEDVYDDGYSDDVQMIVNIEE